jgi:hypothetical protein
VGRREPGDAVSRVGGTVDTGAARAAFRDVGYEYDDGTLVERN